MVSNSVQFCSYTTSQLYIYIYIYVCIFFSFTQKTYIVYINIFKIFTHFYACSRVFWLNIAKNQIHLWYKYCSKWFGKMRRKVNFDNDVAKVLRKSMRKNREMIWWREKENWISLTTSLKFMPKIRGVLQRKRSGREEKTNCGNQVAKIVGEERENI